MDSDAGDAEQQHTKTGPAGYMADDAEWPAGALAAGAPPEAHLIRAMVEKITDLMAQRSLTRADLAAGAGLSRQNRLQPARRGELARDPHHRRAGEVLQAPAVGQRAPQDPLRAPQRGPRRPDSRRGAARAARSGTAPTTASSPKRPQPKTRRPADSAHANPAISRQRPRAGPADAAGGPVGDRRTPG